MNSDRRHLISLRDLTDGDIEWIVDRGLLYASARRSPARSLERRIVGVYFVRTSTRTRTAFTAAVLKLGANAIAYGPADLQVNTGETMRDTGRALACSLDALVVRTAGDPAEMRELAEQGRMSVVNAMSADEHPTQALADLTTLRQHFGHLEGLRVLYVGEGNNTATALCLALSRQLRTKVYACTPPGYGLPPVWTRAIGRAAEAHHSMFEERHDLDRLPPTLDVIYTTRWQTTGTVKEDPDWRDVFGPFRVDSALLDRFQGAIFMHDLPAHRGEEVTGDVIDGPASFAFAQAANKLYSAMAVLEWCLGDGAESEHRLRRRA